MGERDATIPFGETAAAPPQKRAAVTETGETVSALDAERRLDGSAAEGRRGEIDETLKGIGLGADHVHLMPVDDRAYMIGEEIARGGMGKILAARDRRLHRDVVIKVVRGEADLRFEREALITARLQHPSIVRVYEAGVLSDGRAFYAMERVRGRGLDTIINDAKTLRDRIALLPHAIAVADAISYAHSERIVHRDLKPSNVLIGPFGETVVIDWGLAKDLRSADNLDAGASDSADISLTRVGAVMGTPSHMAPEQARGEPADERTDIYAIGAVLYQMLCGHAPYDADTPVAVVLELAKAGEHEPITRREPLLPPDLIAIVDRAMAADRDQRFASAKELADELRRYASGQLVASHTYKLSTLVRRWLWKHRVTVGVAAAALVVLSVLAAISIREVVRARDDARQAASDAHLERDKAERKADDAIITQATEQLKEDPSRALALLDELSDRGIARPAANQIAIDAAAAGLAWELRGHADDVEHLVVSHDGAHVGTASDDATIRWWKLDDLSFTTLRGHTGPINDLIVAADDKRLASAGTDHVIFVWDPATGTAMKLAKHENTVRGIAFSPDGTHLVSTGEDGALYLWDLATGDAKLLVKYPHGLRAVTWGGGQIVVGGYDGAIGHFDPATGKGEMSPAAHAEIRRLAVSPDGTQVASGDEDGMVILWKLDGTKLAELGQHVDVAREVMFTPDGKRLVSCGGDNLVRVYADGKTIELKGNHTGVKHIAISRDGTRVASAGLDGVVRVWPITGGKPRELRGHGYPVKHVDWTPDGRVVSGSEDDRARIWSLAPVDPPPTGPALRTWIKAHTNVLASR